MSEKYIVVIKSWIGAWLEKVSFFPIKMSSQNFETLGSMPTAMGIGTSDSTGCKDLSKKLSSQLLFWSDYCLFTYESTRLRHRFRKQSNLKTPLIKVVPLLQDSKAKIIFKKCVAKWNIRYF